MPVAALTRRHYDKDALLAIKQSLQSRGLISDMFVIPEGAVQETTLKAVRVAAARHGADAVLVVSGCEALDRYNNVLGVTYLLLLPMAFVPGTELDALFMTDAVLWDVRNAYLYVSAEAEGTAHQTRPTMFIEELQAVNEARTTAMKALAAELARRLTAMEQTAGTH